MEALFEKQFSLSDLGFVMQDASNQFLRAAAESGLAGEDLADLDDLLLSFVGCLGRCAAERVKRQRAGLLHDEEVEITPEQFDVILNGSVKVNE